MRFRDEDQIDEDNKLEDKDIYVTPGQYILYIPRCVFVAISGNTIHAGGFCFGRKVCCQNNKNATKKPHELKLIGLCSTVLCMRSYYTGDDG